MLVFAEYALHGKNYEHCFFPHRLLLIKSIALEDVQYKSEIVSRLMQLSRLAAFKSLRRKDLHQSDIGQFRQDDLQLSSVDPKRLKLPPLKKMRTIL